MERVVIGMLALAILLFLFPVQTLSWIPSTVVGIAISILFLTPLLDVVSGKTDEYTLASLLFGSVLYVLYTEFCYGGDFVKSAVFVLQWMATTCFISYATTFILKRMEKWIVR